MLPAMVPKWQRLRRCLWKLIINSVSGISKRSPTRRWLMDTVHDVLQQILNLYESIIYHWNDTLGVRAFDQARKTLGPRTGCLGDALQRERKPKNRIEKNLCGSAFIMCSGHQKPIVQVATKTRCEVYFWKGPGMGKCPVSRKMKDLRKSQIIAEW